MEAASSRVYSAEPFDFDNDNQLPECYLDLKKMELPVVGNDGRFPKFVSTVSSEELDKVRRLLLFHY